MKKRNCLIELYRFLFALNVVKSHGMFPYTGPYVGPGRVSVEFFFVLTGYLLIKGIDKYLEFPFKEGIWKFFVSRIKPILIPVAIAIPCNIINGFLLDPIEFNIWSYLWYVETMLIISLAYYCIKYFVKDKKIFITIIAIIFVVATLINMTPTFYSWGYFRGASAISLGMLIGYIPNLKIKHKNLLWIILVPIQLFIIHIVVFGNTPVTERILNLVLYPSLIYLTFNLEINNKIINKIFIYLGSLSFGLYAYQCVVKLIRTLGLSNIWIMFILLVIFTLVDDVIKRIYKKKKLATA